MSSLRLLLILTGLFTSLLAVSQHQAITIALATRLDSIRMCPGKEKHFGDLYFRTTLAIEESLKNFLGSLNY